HERWSREHHPARGQRSQPHRHDRLRLRHASRRHRRLAAAVVVPAVDERHLHLRLGCSVARHRHPLSGHPGPRARVVRVERAPTSTYSVALVGVFTLATVAVAALNLPFADEGRGPNSFEYAIPAARDLAGHMGSLEGQGPLLIDDLFHGAFADPYGGAAAAELQLRGIPFVTGDAALERHLGPARHFNGRNAKAALLLRTGDATLETPAGSRLVARGEGLSAADQRELSRLKAQITEYLVQGRLRLDRRGQAALERGALPNLPQVQTSRADPRVLL